MTKLQNDLYTYTLKIVDKTKFPKFNAIKLMRDWYSIGLIEAKNRVINFMGGEPIETGDDYFVAQFKGICGDTIQMERVDKPEPEPDVLFNNK